MNHEDEALVAVAPTVRHDRMQLHRETRKVVKEEDGEKSEGELADATLDGVDVLGRPEPRDTGEAEVGRGAEDGEGEVCVDEVGAVGVVVEAEIAGVVSDGETDAEEVDGEENQRVERRVSDLCDGVDFTLTGSGIEMHFFFFWSGYKSGKKKKKEGVRERERDREE